MQEQKQPPGDHADAVLHVQSADDLNKLLAEKPAIVYFWAPWCGPCRMFGPIFAEVAREFAGEVSFIKVNTEEARELAGLFQIRSIPTVIAFRGGKIANVHIGVMQPEPLRKMARRAATEPKGFWARIFGS